MIFIYYFKNILSIKDIETLLAPITEKYFHNDSDFNITSIYKEVCELEKSRIDVLQRMLQKPIIRRCSPLIRQTSVQKTAVILRNFPLSLL